MYPVELAYLKEPTADYVKAAAKTAWQINMQVYYPRTFSE
jgi:ATP-dependent RNA helicase DDX35